MTSWNIVLVIFCASFVITIRQASAQYEDVRCKCVCPSPEVVHGAKTNRKIYIGNVSPSKCNCDGVVLPQVGDDIKGKEKEFCPRCKCKYESRNTAIIRWVIIIIIGIISFLVVYMLFLMCLDPLLQKPRGAYQEHTNEEVNLQDEPMATLPRHIPSTTNVLNRVGQQQDKWKKQVQEQRLNIYDRHTMLN